MNTTLIPFSKIAEYRRWRTRRTGSAYFRCVPTTS